tara:strand:+ start:214 stop:573 length:360 start_codon:yes stop_codon:yes gene_type:complete
MNHYLKSLLNYLCILLIICGCLSCSPKEITQLKQNDPLTIKGVLTIVGNEPFTQYAIRSKKYDYTLPLIIRKTQDESTIKNHIGKHVTLKGNFYIETKTTVKESKKIDFYYLIVDSINK